MPAAQKIAASRGHEHAADAEFARDHAGVHCAGAAGADQREFRAGRSPCWMEIARMAEAMFTFMTRYMPAAAAVTSRPSGSAMRSATAARAASRSSRRRPPAKKSGSR